MTTYWLLGEKKNPSEANNEAVLSEEQEEPQLLVSQQPNAPSITRELVADVSENTEKMETTPLLSNNGAEKLTNNGATHPI